MAESESDPRGGAPEQRAYIRHPATIPLRVTASDHHAGSRMCDVSHGGLAFSCDRPYVGGTPIEIRIPQIDADFRARAIVVWCHYTGCGYRIGARFPDPDDAFRSRMVEQLCEIETFRRGVLEREGRYLSPEQAAREWIERHGDTFPDP